MTEANQSVRDDLLWGHPKGLYILFFTETWERFSYYGMRALLIYYMTKHLLFTQEMSSQIYGLYTGLVYFTPFFGGLIADRYLGQRKTVILGGVLMAVGHFLMALEAMFFPALIFLICGNGAFKPNISTQVGYLYAPGDSRRDRAFSIFYVGINLGAFLSPLVCGTLGELYGWHYGFSLAGVGMVVGLVIYLTGQRYLASDYLMLKKAMPEKENLPLTRDERSRIWALVVLCLFNIIFWSAYEQQGNTLALWADEDTNRRFLGWEIPASWFQSLNPMLIIILTPLVTTFWSWQAKRDREPSSAAKMGFGCIFLCISYLIMVLPAKDYAVDGTPVSMWWLVANSLFLTIGELYLSPVGLSLVTKLAPGQMVSMIMGVWFLSSFFGNYLAGFLGTFWEKMSRDSFFIMLAVIALIAGLGIFTALKPLKQALSYDRERPDPPA